MPHAGSWWTVAQKWPGQDVPDLVPETGQDKSISEPRFRAIVCKTQAFPEIRRHREKMLHPVSSKGPAQVLLLSLEGSKSHT